MRTHDELVAELDKCTAELEEIRREEDELMPKSTDSPTAGKLPPTRMTKELLAKIHEVHERQITVFNKRAEILHELHEVHEELHSRPTTREEQALERVLARATQQARELFLSLHEVIIKLGEVEVLPGRWWIDYRKNKVTFLTMVTPDFEREGLGLTIKMGNRQINDPKGWTKRIDGTSDLNTTFRLDTTEHIDYAMSLIRQAFNNV